MAATYLPTYTPNYSFAYFPGGYYDPVDESQRWNSIDVNFNAIAAVVGNGVINGWDVIAEVSTDGWLLSISPGNGIAQGFSIRTDDVDASLTAYPSNDGEYLCASITATTYYDESVTFGLYPAIPEGAVCLALITTTADAITIDTSDKQIISITQELLDQINAIISTHKHDGIISSKIDLTTEVSGQLDSANIGYVPYSKITGNIYEKLVGTLSHDDLLHIGHYSHTAIDDYIAYSDAPDYSKFGDIAITNTLQNLTTLVHALGTSAQEHSVNARVVIPGITASSWNDYTKTTALLDYNTHLISGTYAASYLATYDSKIWQREPAFYERYNSGEYVNETSNVQMNTDNNLTLQVISTYFQYNDKGDFVIDFIPDTPVNWNSVTWDAAMATGVGSISLQYQISNAKDSTNNAYSWSADNYSEMYSGTLDTANTGLPVGMGFPGDTSTIDTQTYTQDLTSIDPSSALRLKFHYTTASLTSSPVITNITALYDNGVDDTYAYKLYNTNDDFIQYTATNNYVNYNTIPGAVVLDKFKNYNLAGNITSTYIDGTPTLLRWGLLYTDTIVPSYTSLTWKARSATAVDDTANLVIDWDTLTPVVNNVYDLSPYQYRYLQVKADMTGNYIFAPGETPEVLDFYTTYYTEYPTTCATAIKYKRWTLNTDGVCGFFPTTAKIDGNFDGISRDYSVTLDNIATDAEGLTILDANKKTALWESIPYVTPETYRVMTANLGNNTEWKDIKVYGENFSTNNVYAIVYTQKTPDMFSCVATYKCTTSPCVINFTDAALAPHATESYIKIAIGFNAEGE